MSTTKNPLLRIWREPHPLRFMVSRVLLRRGINLKHRLTFSRTHNVQTYLHASSAAHKLFIGRYRPQLDIAVFARYITPESTVFDIGANIGMLTSVAGRLASDGAVHAFEATPYTFGCLLDNIRLNGLQNIYPVYAAVCNETGLVSFFEHTYSHEQNYIAPEGAGTIHVPAVSLGAYMTQAGVRKIDFLKIDVEGAELSVLQSLGEQLAAVQTIYFEYTNSERYDYAPAVIYDLLTDAGFALYAPSLVDDALHLEPFDHADTSTSKNLLAVRS